MGLRLAQLERIGSARLKVITGVATVEMAEDLRALALDEDARAAEWLVDLGDQVLKSVNDVLDIADGQAETTAEVPRLRAAGMSGVVLGLLAIGYGIAVDEITGGM